MKLSLRPTTIDDLSQVREFLKQAFNGGEDDSFLEPDLMRWKYWEARKDWAEPRAYVLEQEGVIVAHAGILPMSFEGGAVRGGHLFDWASSRQVQGAGRALLAQLGDMFEFIYTVGGTKRTRKLLPTLGFEEYCKIWNYARPLRPLRQIVSHPNRDWKLGARLARNSLWAVSKTRSGRVPAGWKANRIYPGAISADLCKGSLGEDYFSPRPPAFFEYILRCPALRLHLYGIEDEKGPRGHFALGLMRGQALVVGVWIRDPDREAWGAAYALAQQVAMGMEGANEIAVSGTAGPSEEGAALSGLRNIEYTPLYMLNPNGKLALRRDFQFQLCDSDAFFLDLGHSAYWT